MTKRILSLLCALAMILGIFSLAACGENGVEAPKTDEPRDEVPEEDDGPKPVGEPEIDEVSGLVFTLLDDDTYSVEGGFVNISKYDTYNVSIPATYKDKPVSTISADGFRAFPIYYVIIPEGIVRIGNGAFADCGDLTQVFLPSSLESIGARAFANCNILYFIQLPEGLKELGNRAFQNCKNLKEITVPGGVETLDETFNDCVSLKKVTLCSGLRKIDDWTFRNCVSLTGINIPESVESIAEDAFLECYALKELSVDPENGVYYSDGGCIIERETMTLLLGSRNGVIPQGVRVVARYAFASCAGITSMVIPESVETVEYPAFNRGFGFAEIINKSGAYVERDSPGGTICYAHLIGYVEHSGESRIDNVDGFLFFTTDDGTHHLVGYNGAGGDITLPSDYKGEPYELDNGAFAGNTDITGVVIPGCIERVSRSAFAGCMNLSRVSIKEGVKAIEAEAFSYCGSLEDLYMPESLEEINSQAFACCVSLKRLTIPSGVSVLAMGAFDNCRGIRSISVDSDNEKYYDKGNCLIRKKSGELVLGCSTSIIPEGVRTIGHSAFRGTRIGKITLPESLEIIGTMAFDDCAVLNSVEIPEGLTKIENSAFSGCISLTEIKLPKSLDEIPDRMLSGCTSLKEIKIPNGVVAIGNNALSGCIGIREIDLPASVIYVEREAFANCSNLRQLGLSSLDLTINGNPILGCDRLEKVTGASRFSFNKGCLIDTETRVLIAGFARCKIPDDGSVLAIGKYAFAGCGDLTEISIPDAVTHIDDYAFGFCTKLRAAKLPSSLKVIGDHAFASCSALVKADLPDGLLEIGQSAFSSCKLLKVESIPDSVKKIGSYAFQGCAYVVDSELLETKDYIVTP